MTETPLANARLKFSNAERHKAALEQVVADFLKAHPAQIVEGSFLNRAPHISFITPDAAVPDEIPLMLGDAIHNLRSSLDLMMVSCFQALKKGTSGVKFPFAENSDKLEDIIKKSLAHGGDDICNLIRKFKPYHGGNSALRALHDLDISDKHKMIILAVREGLYEQTQIKIFKNGELAAHIKAGHLLESNPRTDVPIKKLRCEVILPEDYDSTAIIFSDSMPFAGRPVLGTLENLFQHVDGILEAFGDLLR